VLNFTALLFSTTSPFFTENSLLNVAITVHSPRV
jgi:hypothetical protein